MKHRRRFTEAPKQQQSLDGITGGKHGYPYKLTQKTNNPRARLLATAFIFIVVGLIILAVIHAVEEYLHLSILWRDSINILFALIIFFFTNFIFSKLHKKFKKH